MTPSAMTAFAGGTLTLAVNTGDSITITQTLQNSAFQFTVADSTNPSIGGMGAGPFTNVQNITVNISATDANILVLGVNNPGQQTPTGISGNFTVTDTQPNNAISVEVHDGFSVGGAVSLSNTGAGSIFRHHTSITNGTQDVTGAFLDPNNQAIYGSVNINGSGSVGFDGMTVVGNVNVNLAKAGSECFFGKEFVFGQDPDAPPWTKFGFAANEIGGNLTITGSSDTELYQGHVHGNVTLTQGLPFVHNNDLVQLGGDAIGQSLSISTPDGKAGVFVDFSSIGGNTLIQQGNGANVVGLQSDFFHGLTTITQGIGADYLFIDSEAALQALHGLPSNNPYLHRLQAAHLLPPDFGSTFSSAVQGTQGQGSHQLEIGQDTSSAITVFNIASSFTAGTGATLDENADSEGIHPDIMGY